ncbi:MAG: helix-turn-helix domain-containing protein [Dehalococcoidia bacterium]|jgi:excisionase family DNA binding protein
MEDKYYTIQEIADILKVDYMTVYRWIRAGKLEAYQVQKHYRIKESDFQKFMEANKKVASKGSQNE